MSGSEVRDVADEQREPFWDEGMRTVQEWVLSGHVPEELRGNLTINTRLRYETVHMCPSLRGMVQKSNFFRWRAKNLEEFREQIEKVLKRDVVLREKLMHLTGFCREHDSIAEVSKESRAAMYYAILEVATAVDILGREYVPKEIEEKKMIKKPRGREFNLQAIVRKARTLIPAPSPEKRSDSTPPRRNRPSEKSPTPTKSPLLFKKMTLGMNRRQSIRKADQRMFTVDSSQPNFMVEKIWNHFDPVTGELSCDAARKPLEYVDESWDTMKVSVPLAQKDITLTDEISIPHPLCQGLGEPKRYTAISSMSTYGISDIAVVSQKGEELMGIDALLPFLQEDTLGNIVLRITQDLKSVLPRKGAFLRVKFSNDYKSRLSDIFCEDEAPSMGRLTEREVDRLSRFLPERIAQLMKQKKAQMNEDSLLDDASLELLLGFLGNYYLHYEEVDAPPLSNEPRGFTQADRVLHQRRSTCEGAHVALAPIIRSMLREGEGINYVTGFSSEGRGSRSLMGSDYHLQILLTSKRDDCRKQVAFLDVTPWPKHIQKQIRSKATTRSRIRKKWQVSSENIVSKRREKKQQVIDTTPQARERIQRVDQDFGRVWESDKQVSRRYSRFSQRTQATLVRSPEDLIDDTDAHGRTLASCYKSLLPYLSTVHGINDGRSECVHPASGSPIEGYFNLSLPGLKLYDIYLKPRDVQRWMHAFEGWFRGPRLLKTLKCILAEAQEASCQNIDVLLEFLQHMHGLTTAHRTTMLQTFDSHLNKKITCSMGEFWNEAPWMEFLPDPMQEMRGAFKRSPHSSTKGFLLPSTPSDVQQVMEDRLDTSGWHDRIKERHDQIAGVLEHLPAEAIEEAPRKIFPPVRLLYGAVGRQIQDGDEKAQLVQADRLWQHLQKELDLKK